MDREIISNRQGICLVSMFIIGSSIVLGASGEAKQDIWISVIVGFVLYLPMIFIYSNLTTVFPGKDLFDIMHEVFGNIAGKILSLIFVWYFFHLGALVIRNFSEFVQIVSLIETPQFIIIIFFGLLCIWIVRSGIEVLSRWSAFTLPIVLFFVLGTVILSFTRMKLINITPTLYNGIRPVFSNAFSIFSFPFAETVIFTMVFNKLKQNNKSFKVFFFGSLIGGIVILLVMLRNILVLGINTASDLFFPSYIAVRTINIGNFLQRFEIVIAVNYIFTGFVKTSICLYAASKGVARILNIKKSNQIVAPIGFLMMNFACFIYSNTMEMFEWVKVYPYYAIPFQIILPVIILIGAKIKLRICTKGAGAM
ncbi:MAG TPA: endospore germination permease [Clostridia bacterium]